eukprot:2580479-Rhodomonas_salina.2
MHSSIHCVNTGKHLALYALPVPDIRIPFYASPEPLVPGHLDAPRLLPPGSCDFSIARGINGVPPETANSFFPVGGPDEADALHLVAPYAQSQY